MKTDLLDANPERCAADKRTLAEAQEMSITRGAALLRAGELVAFPTDTVYGIGAFVSQPSAIERLYVAKGRPPEKAIPILIADVKDLEVIVAETDDLVRRIIACFWPGALTLVLPKRDVVPSAVSPTPYVAVRLPDYPLTRTIITAVGAPLAVTSANRSGQPSPRTAAGVLAQLDGRIAAVIDGGTCPGGFPSTVLDCSTYPPRILRAGAIRAEAIRQVTRLA